MIIAADYPLLEILATVAFFFLWMSWIWMLVIVLSDVFGRSDLSGWGKAAWALLIVFLPFIGVFSYLIAHGGEMGERRAARVSQGAPAPPSSSVDEIAQAQRLLESGAIDAAEFAQLKRGALARSSATV